MGEIIITVPKRKRKIQIVKSEAVLNDWLEKKTEQIKKKFAADEEKKEENKIVITAEGLEELEEEDMPIENEKEEVVFEMDLEKDCSNIEEKIASIVLKENINDLDTETAKLEDIEIEEIPEAPNQIIFTEIYTIGEDNEPVQISNDIEQIKNQNKNLIDAEFFEKNIQEAYNKGYNDAQEIALLNAKEKIEEAHNYIRRIDNFMFELRKHYLKQINYAKEKIIDISKNVAEVILETEINSDSNVVIKQIQRVFDEINNEKIFSIRINSADYNVLIDAKSDLIKQNHDTISFIKDDSIKKGSCILYTAMGTIDAAISKQLNKLINEINNIEKENLPSKDDLIDFAVPDAIPISEEALV